MGDHDPTRPRVASPSPGTLRAGTVLGRYVLVRLLGQGGSAEVHAAHDQRLQREVALKVLHRRAPDPQHTTAAMQQGWDALLHEAQALARLSHPNVVTVHDVVVQDQRVLLSMELVDGVDLSTWGATAPARSVVTRLRVLAQAGAGLAAAHAAGLVHRDFKPANVLVSREGTARVVDFGLAAWGRLDPWATSWADPGNPEHADATATAYGTPAFMAPEQHRGEPGDRRVDVYALCVTAWRVLFGVHPFAGDDVDALGRAKALGPPAWPRSLAGVPRPLVRLLQQGLEPDPNRRPPTLDPLLAALARASRPRRVWPVVVGGAMAVTVAGAGVAVVMGLDRTLVVRPNPCLDATAEMDARWGPAARADLRAGFDALEVGWAPYARNIAVRELDRYAQGWGAMATRACWVRQADQESATVVAARSACLQERVDAFAEVVAGFDALDEPRARSSAEEIRAIPAVAVCGDAEAMRRRAPMPDDPQVQAEVRRLRTSLAAVRGLKRKGNTPAALRLARRTVTEAEASGVEAVKAEAHYWLGVMLRNTGDDAGAEEAMHAAVAAAAAARHDVVQADAWIDLVHLVGRRGRHDEALRYARFAQAALDRIDAPLRTSSRLAASRGTVYSAMGQTEDALAQYEAARALDVAIYGARDVEGLATLQHIGSALSRLRRFDRAELIFAHGLQVAHEGLGSEHPTTARFELSYAGVLAQRGGNELARPHYEAGLAIRERVLAPDDPDRAQAHRAFAVFESNQKRYAEAHEHLLEAVEVLDRRDPPVHDELARTLNELCATTYRLGQIDEAWAHCTRARGIAQAQEHPDLGAWFTSVNRQAIIARRRDQLVEARTLRLRAVELAEQAWGAQSTRLAEPLLGTASLDIELEEPAAALPRVRRVLALRGPNGEAHDRMPYAQLLLARAMVHRDPKEAQSHAEQAWRSARAATDADVEKLAAAWLRERDLPLPK